MADKVYIKNPGGPLVPVTVRVDWLPTGSIRPISYWTPDGSCYEVTRIFETIPLAFVKDRGEGLRIKVRAEIEGGAKQYADYHHVTLHETYLYFIDNFFCGKNIIDERYKHDEKAYIPVTLDIFPSGDYEIVFYEVHGRKYMVDKTVKKELRGSFHAGGIGIRHEVKSRQIDSQGDDLVCQSRRKL